MPAIVTAIMDRETNPKEAAGCETNPRVADSSGFSWSYSASPRRQYSQAPGSTASMLTT